jgi:hypothetical protein
LGLALRRGGNNPDPRTFSIGAVRGGWFPG